MRKFDNKKIMSYDIISFDIFDTLIIRDVNDESEIFKEVYFSVKDTIGIDSHEFVETRLRAYSQLKSEKKLQEVKLEEIYKSISSSLGIENTILQEMEESLQVKHVFPNEEIKQLYQMLLDNNKTIIITSDMYLSERIIRVMLEKCGYYDYREIFLSSEMNMRKSRGTIFRHIKREFPNQRIIHIGDNLKSDYIMPRLYGLNAFHYDKRKCRF